MAEHGHGEQGGGSHGEAKKGGKKVFGNEFLELTIGAIPSMLRSIFDPKNFSEFVRGLGNIFFGFISGPVRRKGGGGGHGGGGGGHGGGHH